MKQRWTQEDLIEHFTGSPDEHALLKNKTATGRLGFTVLLKFHQYAGRFPTGPKEVPDAVVAFLAKQLGRENDFPVRLSEANRTAARDPGRTECD